MQAAPIESQDIASLIAAGAPGPREPGFYPVTYRGTGGRETVFVARWDGRQFLSASHLNAPLLWMPSWVGAQLPFDRDGPLA